MEETETDLGEEIGAAAAVVEGNYSVGNLVGGWVACTGGHTEEK